MRYNNLTKDKMSNSKLNRICNITATEIFEAHNKKIGFWEKCGIIIDKFVNKITGSKNTKKLLNEAIKQTNDLKINETDQKILDKIKDSLNSHLSTNINNNTNNTTVVI